MGGKALKNFNVVRYSSEEYGKVLVEFTILALDFIRENPSADFQFRFPIPLKGKEDFGDLDVLYSTTQNEKILAFFKSAFKSKGVVSNGNVRSCEWECIEGKPFQIDLIYVGAENLDWSYAWYSHGDQAAVKGKVYHYYNLKLGNDGLYWRLRGKSYARDILITKDWKLANNFLGYKPLHPEYNYSPEDLFEHTISSPYVHAGIFNSLKMDRPRKDQVDFYAWVSDKLEDRVIYPKSLGYKLVRGYSMMLYFKIRYAEFLVKIREFFTPIFRKYRKMRYQFNVAAFKAGGWL